MNGVIAKINPHRRMVGVKTENGDYSIFELLSGDELNVGDHVEWSNETIPGDAVIKNKTASTAFAVYFQNHHVSQAILNAQLLI